MNAETPLPALRRRFVTEVRDFYVRSHGEMPRTGAAGHRLRVGGRVSRPLLLSLAEMKERFEPTTLPAVLQCAGNRRGELAAVRPVSGNPWAPGAIGNAEWTGVPLASVLRAAGAEAEAAHVAFRGLDAGEDGAPFTVSIPMRKAAAPEVLLAWAMNGAPLTPEHGAPLRAVVPGWAAVRSAKWLAAIEVRDEPADGPIQRRDYKLFPPDVSAETADWDSAPAIEEMPLNAAICEPAPGADLPIGPCAVRGYAVGCGVSRVEVSADNGASWVEATLDRRTDAPWSWLFWDASVHLAAGPSVLAVRAWDEAGRTQPALPAAVWNFKGYLCNSWHRVAVRAA